MVKQTKETKQPREQLDVWLRRQVGRFRGAYDSFERAGELHFEEYGNALMNLEKHYGREKVEQAIERIIATIPNFAPAIPDLQNFIPMPERKYCSKCAPQEGWEYVWEENCKYPKLRRCRHTA